MYSSWKSEYAKLSNVSSYDISNISSNGILTLSQGVSYGQVSKVNAVTRVFGEWIQNTTIAWITFGYGLLKLYMTMAWK